MFAIWSCILLLLGMESGHALIAYDCQNQQMKYATFSLTDVGKCQPVTAQHQVTAERIQLLQLQDVATLPVYQCKIHVTRILYYCGMHSHLSAVPNGLATYLHPISRHQCLEMHQRKSLMNFYRKNIDHLVINGTSYATVIMAGQLNGDSSCRGEDYEDHKGQWSNVIAQATLEISLFEQYAPANIQQNIISLPGGIACQYKEKFCIDSIFGHSFWDHVDQNQCSSTKYTVLYEGEATKLTPRNYTVDNYEAPIYSVDQGDVVFAMPISRPTTICGQSAYETDHPKFFIVKPSETGRFYFYKRQVQTLTMDPTAYTNAKFVFVERHIRGQISKLYADVVAQRCELEQQVLRNLQTLAVTSPSEFAYAKMQQPGYTAINYGEVIHIIECKPVEVTIRRTSKCYHELPINYDNSSLFMAPRTHIIQRYATEIDCNPFFYPLYKIQNTWYELRNGLHEIVSPQILEPSNSNKWIYKSPHNLFKGGLYTQEDMEDLRMHLVLPMERQAVTSILSRGMTGRVTDLQGTNLQQLLDENTLENWFKSTTGQVWNWFITFGTITSGVMGIFFAWKAIKFIVDTIVHGFLLYDILGFGIHLISALFNSITMLLIHRHHKSGRNGQTSEKDVEMQTLSPSVPETNDDQLKEETSGTLAYPKLTPTIPDWMKET